MKLSHEDYLNQKLISKKLELDNVLLEHRIAIAEFNVKREMLQSQIDSIDRQLKG
ncbi:hypothetical protein [Bacillus infantis]|uniref:hypothetical protein n=1 Tax=Bacillus infantis TaxID=324767 RepID=UPI003CFA1FCD